MKFKLIFICFSCVIFCSENKINKWHEFILTPDSTNFQSIYIGLENAINHNNKEYKEDLIKNFLNFNNTDFKSFIKLINVGNKYSIELGFMLLKFSDGIITNILNVSLGNVIKINPVLFLRLLQKHKDIITRISPLLCALGYNYVDQFEKQLDEIKLRIKSIEGVSTPELQDIKKVCLMHLYNKKTSIEELLNN